MTNKHGLAAAAYLAWINARVVRGLGPTPILARRHAENTARRELATLTRAKNPHLARLARDAAEAQPFFHEWKHAGQIIDIS